MTSRHPVIHLRPFKASDAPAFTSAINASLASLIPWMSWAYQNYQQHEAESWIQLTQLQRLAGEAEELAIADGQDRLSGGSGIRFARNSGELSSIGYWVRSDAQGNGIATRAVKQLLALGFSRSDTETIEILAAEENFGSRTLWRAFYRLLRRFNHSGKRPDKCGNLSLSAFSLPVTAFKIKKGLASCQPLVCY